MSVDRAPRVTKLSGAGNDFVVLAAEEMQRVVGDRRTWIEGVCSRRLSIGADGVIVVERTGENRVHATFYNPDGSTAFCGNGSRCAARFAHLQGLAGAEMILETDDVEIPAAVSATGEVRLVLPVPTDRGPRTVELDGRELEGRWVHAGAPHFVLRVPDVDAMPFEEWAPCVRRDPLFGERGTNFDATSELGRGRLRMRTWERGVEGETLACGSGALASVFAWRLDGGPQRVTVVSSSGVPLSIELPGAPSAPTSAVLEGEARIVFEGTVHAEATAWKGA
ncbi:MAG: diaminopimelate epimerase [bacterium]|nr:diaminopimelate epimerase [bacterium]